MVVSGKSLSTLVLAVTQYRPIGLSVGADRLALWRATAGEAVLLGHPLWYATEAVSRGSGRGQMHGDVIILKGLGLGRRRNDKT